MWTVLKVFNNNALMACDEHNEHCVLLGRGIGFQAKKGDQIDAGKVHQVLRAENGQYEQLRSIIQEISPELLDIALRLAQDADKKFGIHFSDTGVLALADHIRFAVDRAIKGIHMPNPLEWEIHNIYPTEVDFAIYCMESIKKETGIQLEESEKTSIALHAVNSAYNSSSENNFARIAEQTELIARISHFVLDYYQVDPHSVAFRRFITHVRFLLERLMGDRKNTAHASSSVEDFLISKHPQEYSFAHKLLMDIHMQFGGETYSAECAYLALHILRLKEESST